MNLPGPSNHVSPSVVSLPDLGGPGFLFDKRNGMA